jgi:hypothetical protein
MSRNPNRPDGPPPVRPCPGPAVVPLRTSDGLAEWLAADLAERNVRGVQTLTSRDLDALAVVELDENRIVVAMLVRIVAAAYEHGDDERLLDAMLANPVIRAMLDADGEFDREPAERRCRVCGCSEFRACPGGCAWVGSEDLCSACDGRPVPAAVILAFGERR